MILETERLILRPWCDDDAEDLYTYASDPDVGPPAGWPPHTSVENSGEIIRTVLSKPEVYAVCLKENGEPIGNIPEAARTLLRRAFEDLCVNAVWCGRHDHNEKSRRVQEKLGFVYHHTTEGLLVPQVNEIRTGYVMLMTKERFQKVELFRHQRKTLDTFLQNGAISRAQYDKSFGDLCELMEMQGVE